MVSDKQLNSLTGKNIKRIDHYSNSIDIIFSDGTLFEIKVDQVSVALGLVLDITIPHEVVTQKDNKTLKDLSEDQLLEIAKIIRPHLFNEGIGKWRFVFVEGLINDTPCRILENDSSDYSFDFDHESDLISVINKNLGDHLGYTPITISTYYKVIEKLKSFGCDLDKMYQ